MPAFDLFEISMSHEANEKAFPVHLGNDLRILEGTNLKYEQCLKETTLVLSGQVDNVYSFGLFGRIFSLDE